MENEPTSTKNIWIIIGLIVIVLALIFLYVLNNQQKTPTVPVSETPQTTEPESSHDTTSQSSGGGTISAPISYADALTKYADKRIQFDKNCQAIPNNVTYKDNTGIMIDNRSPQTRTIKIGGTYTVKPYGFRIVVLPDTYRQSKTFLVDCDKYQNVATILIQE